MIEGVVGNGYTGDIAIDDLSMTPGCVPATAVLPMGSAPPPTSPNPCVAGQFTCDNNYCLPMSKVCDFVNQCMDTTDEAQCGTCFFETGNCGWRDHSTGQFSWNNVPANSSLTTYGPSNDADNSPSGHYMLVQTSSGVTKDRAMLISPVFNASGSACHMTFSYHMLGSSAGIPTFPIVFIKLELIAECVRAFTIDFLS